MTPTLTLREGREKDLNKFFIGLLNNERLIVYPAPPKGKGGEGVSG